MTVRLIRASVMLYAINIAHIAYIGYLINRQKTHGLQFNCSTHLYDVMIDIKYLIILAKAAILPFS